MDAGDEGGQVNIDQRANLDLNASTSKYDSVADPVIVHDSTKEQADEVKSSETVQSAPLSKKGQKKLAREARYQEHKLERRAKEKERKKVKKRLAREEVTRKREAGEPVSDDERPRKKTKETSAEPFGARLVVDLGFDDKMIDKEIKSLTGQLAYTYSANRRASRPFSSLLFTSFNGRTRERLASQSDQAYKRWTGTEWWDDGYEGLWDEPSFASVTSSRTKCEKSKVIYLTADADEELSELREDEIYIIGGIVDHNRYKNLCQNKAKEQNIRTARLPIGKYLAEMTTRKVLTVNQVVEILLEWTATKDWSKALYSVVPKRKYQSTESENGWIVFEDDAGYDQPEDSPLQSRTSES